MAELLFWISIFLICYTYFFYPLILMLLRVIKKKPVNKKEMAPSVSFIIAAYNEEKNIRSKIENTLNLIYPKHDFEIIVASDCSTDSTDEIVREYGDRGVMLVRSEERKGKTAARNKAVGQATGEILVFSDATTLYKPDAIRMLVRNFNDPSIGCVSGDIVYTNGSDGAAGAGGMLYWKYESWIKQMESDTGSVLGATGCIYALRSSLYTPFCEDDAGDFQNSFRSVSKCKSLDDDFLTPLQLYIKGFRSVVEPKAIAFEETSKKTSEEFKMRSRIITRAISGLIHMRRLLNPLRFGFYSVELFSHKIVRWLVPLLMLSALLANCFLRDSTFYSRTLHIQFLFYLLSLLGYAFERVQFSKLRAMYIPYYFCVVNLAILVGIFKYMIGKRDTIWTPIR